MGDRLALLALVLALGCSDDEAPGTGEGQAETEQALDTDGEVVTPPFDVKGDCEGLLLVWFDDEGPHTAETRDDIPEAHRERVRVDSLRLAPDQRLDPAFVYLADLRGAGEGGAYTVRKVRREAFEALLDRAAGVEVAAETGGEDGQPAATGDVIIYGADWCGACHQAAAYFRARHVAFVEKNIEHDAEARAEMQRKADAAGVSTAGIPIIDFHGTILAGFDPGRLDSLIQHGAAPI